MKQSRIDSLLDSIGVPPASGKTWKATEMTDYALYNMGVDTHLLKSLAEKQSQAWEHNATVGIGLGVALWTHLAVFPFLIKHSPSAIASLIQHWEKVQNLTLAYEVVDLLGLENLIVGSWHAAGVAVDLAMDYPELFANGIEIAISGFDLVEGVASLGVGLAASYGVKKAFEYKNATEEEKLKKLEPICTEIDRLNVMLRKSASPGLILVQIRRVPPQVLEV